MVFSKSDAMRISHRKTRNIHNTTSLSVDTMELSSESRWALLETSISRLVDYLSEDNIQDILLQLFQVNLFKGKGLLARKIIETQRYEHRQRGKPAWIYASLINVLNHKVPEIGEIVISKLLIVFKREYLYNKYLNVELLCELVNYKVMGNLVILQILEKLMNQMSNESIKVVIRILKLVNKSIPTNILYMLIDRLRNLMNEGLIDDFNKVGVNQLLSLRRKGFKSNRGPILIEEETCHDSFDLLDSLRSYNELMLDNDDDYESYENVKEEILREMTVMLYGPEINDDEPKSDEADLKPQDKVVDLSQADLIQLQKTVYLTIMSSMTSEEAVHKLLKLKYDANILTDIIIRSCLQEKVYSKYYGIIGEILILKFTEFKKQYETKFDEKYEVVHQLELNEIRNFGKLYGYLISTNKLLIDLLQVIKLTENDTNSSSRIFIKFLLKEILEELGMDQFKKIMLNNRDVLTGMFPMEGPSDDLIFSINYFTAIGLGILTNEMRNELQQRNERGRKRTRSPHSSRSGSYSRSYSRSSSGSYSGSSRSGSYSRSRSGSRSRSFSRSGSENGSK